MRLPRYSLQSLILFVVMASVVCGFARSSWDAANRQRAAIDRVRSSGGTVIFPFETDAAHWHGRWPSWCETTLGEDFLYKPDTVATPDPSAVSDAVLTLSGATRLDLGQLFERRITVPESLLSRIAEISTAKDLLVVVDPDIDVNVFSKFSSLTHLQITTGPSFSNTQLESLQSCRGLIYLGICARMSAPIARFALPPSVEKLTLVGPVVKMDAVPFLRAAARLRLCAISTTGNSDVICELRRCRPDMTVLELFDRPPGRQSVAKDAMDEIAFDDGDDVYWDQERAVATSSGIGRTSFLGRAVGVAGRADSEVVVDVEEAYTHYVLLKE